MPTQQSENISTGIKRRFYEAFNVLLENKVIRGRQTYCRLYDIDKRLFYAQEKELERKLLKLYWLVPLVEVYNVSARWLLTGKVRMMAAKKVEE